MVLPPVVLTAAALWMVNRSVTKQVIDGIHEDLTRSSLVLENLLGARSEKLGVTARVIARDPRFFAALTLPELGSDPQELIVAGREVLEPLDLRQPPVRQGSTARAG